MIFQGYNPFKPKQAEPEVPESVKTAARLAGATHISSDGKIAYMIRMGKVCWADWNGRDFGKWWSTNVGKMSDEAIQL